jgi:hypothetical protein
MRFDVLQSAIAPIVFLSPDSGGSSGATPPAAPVPDAPAAPAPTPTPAPEPVSTEPDLSGVSDDINDIMGFGADEPEPAHASDLTPDPDPEPVADAEPVEPAAPEPTPEPEVAAEPPAEPSPTPAPVKEPVAPAPPADTTDYASTAREAEAKWQAENNKLAAVEAEIDKLDDDDFPTAGMLKRQAAAKREMAKAEQQYADANARLTQQQEAQTRGYFANFATANKVDASAARAEYDRIHQTYAAKYPGADVRALAAEKLADWAKASKTPAVVAKPAPVAPKRPVVVRPVTPGGARIASAQPAREAANKSMADRVADGEYDLSSVMQFITPGE